MVFLLALVDIVSLHSDTSPTALPSSDDVVRWFDAIWGGASQQRTLAQTSFFDPDRMLAALSAVLFPPLPPWLQTACWVSRLLAFLVVAPIIVIELIDFAEYAVVRTLGLRRRKVRVKRSEPRPRFHLSPAQMSNNADAQGLRSQGAPLLTPGAYDAQALLRHRARSASSASAEAIDEWQRTGGSFARVSHVRQAASEATTPEAELSDDGARSPSIRQASVGFEGPLGLSESEAEDSGTESGQSSPVLSMSSGSKRQGLKSSKLHFTPLDVQERKHYFDSKGAAADDDREEAEDQDLSSRPQRPIAQKWEEDLGEHVSVAQAAAAAAADLERDLPSTPIATAHLAPNR